MRNEAIEVADVVAVQPQSSKLLQVLESGSLDSFEIVPGKVEHVQALGHVGEGLVGELDDLVSGEAEPVQAGHSGKAPVFDRLDLVVGKVEHLELGTLPDKIRN